MANKFAQKVTQIMLRPEFERLPDRPGTTNRVASASELIKSLSPDFSLSQILIGLLAGLEDGYLVQIDYLAQVSLVENQAHWIHLASTRYLNGG